MDCYVYIFTDDDNVTIKSNAYGLLFFQKITAAVSFCVVDEAGLSTHASRMLYVRHVMVHGAKM